MPARMAFRKMRSRQSEPDVAMTGGPPPVPIGLSQKRAPHTPSLPYAAYTTQSCLPAAPKHPHRSYLFHDFMFLGYMENRRKLAQCVRRLRILREDKQRPYRFETSSSISGPHIGKITNHFSELKVQKRKRKGKKCCFSRSECKSTATDFHPSFSKCLVLGVFFYNFVCCVCGLFKFVDSLTLMRG